MSSAVNATDGGLKSASKAERLYLNNLIWEVNIMTTRLEAIKQDAELIFSNSVDVDIENGGYVRLSRCDNWEDIFASVLNNATYSPHPFFQSSMWTGVYEPMLTALDKASNPLFSTEAEAIYECNEVIGCAMLSSVEQLLETTFSTMATGSALYELAKAFRGLDADMFFVKEDGSARIYVNKLVDFLYGLADVLSMRSYMSSDQPQVDVINAVSEVFDTEDVDKMFALVDVMRDFAVEPNATIIKYAQDILDRALDAIKAMY